MIVAQPASRQFDLACTELAHSGRASVPEYRFRIDLDQNRWCEGTCDRPQEIVAVTADRYTLVSNDYRGRTLRTASNSYIDRVSGEHFEQNVSIGATTQIDSRRGRCERAPYSGMPSPRL